VRIPTTNPSCINSDGASCIALAVVHDGCNNATCPFCKTEFQFKVTESRARRRCDGMGIPFTSRDEVLAEYTRSANMARKRKERNKVKTINGVIKYNSGDHIYVEYDSLESASVDTGIPTMKLKLLIEKNEEYQGYKYVWA